MHLSLPQSVWVYCFFAGCENIRKHAAFEKLNVGYWLVDSRTIETSRSYRPVLRLSGLIFPYAERLGEQLPQADEKQDA